MISIIKTFMAAVLCLLVICSCSAQSRITTVTGKKLQASTLDGKIDSIRQAAGIPAVSLAIVNKNKVVYHNAFGVLKAGEDKPVNRETIFEAASLSKPIFAYFVLKMVEKGLLDLDKPLYQYLEHPGIAEDSQEAYRQITARMVLSHQTGFPNHSNGKPISLAFVPGTDFMYSGEAFQYLAAIVGKLNGVGYRADLNNLFRKEVAEPLDMAHSSFVWDNYLAAHKAYGHNSQGEPTGNGPGGNGETFFAYSSLHSQAGEYASFLVALLQQEGLRRETFADMFAEHTRFKDDNPLKQQIGQTGWGLGMAQKQTAHGTMHMHTGNNHDFQAYMMVLPDRDFGIVFFTNSDKAIPFIQGLNAVMGPVF